MNYYMPFRANRSLWHGQKWWPEVIECCRPPPPGPSRRIASGSAMAGNRLEAEQITGQVITRYREQPRAELVPLLDTQDELEVGGLSGHL